MRSSCGCHEPATERSTGEDSPRFSSGTVLRGGPGEAGGPAPPEAPLSPRAGVPVALLCAHQGGGHAPCPGGGRAMLGPGAPRGRRARAWHGAASPTPRGRRGCWRPRLGWASLPATGWRGGPPGGTGGTRRRAARTAKGILGGWSGGRVACACPPGACSGPGLGPPPRSRTRIGRRCWPRVRVLGRGWS